MKRVTIILLNYNGAEDTRACLVSLAKLRQTKIRINTILIDNGSKQQIDKSSIQQYTNVTIINKKENLGFSGGNNVGMQKALKGEADYVMLLNNDTIVDPELVESLVSEIEKDEMIGIVGPKIYFAQGYEYHKDRYTKSELGSVLWYAGGKIDWNNVYASHRGVDEVDTGQYDRQEDTDFVSGCCMLIRRSVLETVGLFDDDYFLYYEDTDLCMRVQRAGLRIVYAPMGIVWHKNAQSSDNPGSDIHVYYQTRNRLLFGMKYASIRTKYALLRESVRFLLGGGMKGKAVKDYWLGNLGCVGNL